MKPASFELLKEPNHILQEEDYQPMELVICLLTWGGGDRSGLHRGHCLPPGLKERQRPAPKISEPPPENLFGDLPLTARLGVTMIFKRRLQ